MTATTAAFCGKPTVSATSIQNYVFIDDLIVFGDNVIVITPFSSWLVNGEFKRTDGQSVETVLDEDTSPYWTHDVQPVVFNDLLFLSMETDGNQMYFQGANGGHYGAELWHVKQK